MAGKKLLVADDSLTIQKVIRLALSNEGYEIQAVSDGNDAIQQVSLFRPDIVLIDVSLPGKSAFEVKRAINELVDLEEVRFVLMSSAFEKVDESQAEQVKFHGRLTKPFDPAHLRQVLGDVLAQVTAKRMEPTAMIQRPSLSAVPTPPSAPAAPTIETTDAASTLDIQIGEPEGAAPVVQEMPSLPNFTMPSAPVMTAPPPTPTPAPPAPAPAAPAPRAPAPAPPLETKSLASEISLTPPGEHDFELTEHDSGPALHLDAPEAHFEESFEPVKPSEPPTLQPPSMEAIGELWDHGAPDLGAALGGAAAPELPTQRPQPPAQAPSVPPPTPPQQAKAQPPAGGSDDDIRQLTESTIRMSGLDDFQWSVKEPSLKPSQNQVDLGSNNFRIEAPSDFPGDMPAFNPDRAEVPTPPSVSSAYHNAPDDEGTHRIQPPPAPAAAGRAASQEVIPVSTAEMEEMIRRQVEETLSRLAQKILPEVAERVIKQEIHRLLSEQP